MRKALALVAVPFVAALTTSLMPVATPGASASVEPQTTEMRYGPIALPPALDGNPVSVNVGLPATPMPCSNCFLTGTAVDMVFDDGRSANLDSGVMLHHTVAFNSGRPDATCGPDTPVGAFGERFFAAGNERTGGDLPPGFGYHLGTDPVRTIAEIMNYSAEAKTVYLAATITHVPDTTEGIKPVTPVWMDENNCNTSQYGVPAGPSNRVASWTSTITGRVVATGGHVHDGGLRTVLANQTTGEQMCSSYAGYGTKPAYMGSVESMTTCIHDRVGTVRAGEVLSIDTYYDSPVAQDGVMGIMLAYVYETDDLTGGTSAAPEPAPANNTPPRTLPGHGHHPG